MTTINTLKTSNNGVTITRKLTSLDDARGVAAKMFMDSGIVSVDVEVEFAPGNVHELRVYRDGMIRCTKMAKAEDAARGNY
jgi:hypothetical protein